jgi:hypothetical protein
MMSNVVQYEKPAMPVVAAVASQAASIVVVDQDTYDFAIDVAKELKRERDLWEEKRVSYKKPLDDLIKLVQADFVPVIQSYDAAVALIKRKAIDWSNAEEAKRAAAQAEANRVFREQQAAAEKAAAKLEKKDPVAAEALREINAVASAPVVAPAVEQAAGDSKRKSYKGKVVNEDALFAFVASHPECRAVFKLDQGALNKLINAAQGRLSIPGVETYVDTVLAIRA